MNPPEYTFSEFMDHLAAIDTVREYRHVTLHNGDDVELAPAHNFESMVIRVMDYMRQLYTDEREAFFKGSRMMLIMNTASHRLQELEDAGLAVIGGGDAPSLVQERAWRALHHFYAVMPLGDYPIEDVIGYALTLEEPKP